MYIAFEKRGYTKPREAPVVNTLSRNKTSVIMKWSGHYQDWRITPEQAYQARKVWRRNRRKGYVRMVKVKVHFEIIDD